MTYYDNLVDDAWSAMVSYDNPTIAEDNSGSVTTWTVTTPYGNDVVFYTEEDWRNTRDAIEDGYNWADSQRANFELDQLEACATL